MLGNKPPYTTMQQLNLDWILSKLKTLLRLVPDDGAVGQILRRTRDGAVWSDEQGGGGGGAVQSVNGKTGAVVLDADDVGALPDDYTPPVTSVNGQTGAVTVSVPVQSVNGKTGAVVLDADDVGALPDDYTPPVTSVNGQTGAVTVSVPVQSVNGKTGAVVLDADDVGALPDDYTPPVTSVNGKTGALSVGVSIGNPTVVSFPFTPDVGGFLTFYLNPTTSSGGYIIVNDGTAYVFACYSGTGTTGVLPVAGGREVRQTSISGVTATVRFYPFTMI